MLECLAAVNLHMFQVRKCFFSSAAEYLHVTSLEGSHTWTMPHPDQQGWSHNGDHQLTFLFVFISSGIHALGCSSAISFSFGVNTSLPCRDRSVMVLFSPKRTVQGRQSIQLGKRTSKLTSYKSVKAMLFVHISLERKEWISCNDVSCIM